MLVSLVLCSFTTVFFFFIPECFNCVMLWEKAMFKTHVSVSE